MKQAYSRLEAPQAPDDVVALIIWLGLDGLYANGISIHQSAQDAGSTYVRDYVQQSYILSCTVLEGAFTQSKEVSTSADRAMSIITLQSSLRPSLLVDAGIDEKWVI